MPKSKFKRNTDQDDADRKRKNATAQALFRARRTNYIATLEEAVANLESVVLTLQSSYRQSKEETRALEFKVSQLIQERREREEYWSNIWSNTSPRTQPSSNSPRACSPSLRTCSFEPAASTEFRDSDYHGAPSSRNFQAPGSADRRNARSGVYEAGRSFHGPLGHPVSCWSHDKAYGAYEFVEQQDLAERSMGPETTYQPPTESPSPTSRITSFHSVPFVEQSKTSEPARAIQDLDYRHGEHPLPGALPGSTAPSFQPAQPAKKVHGQDFGPRRCSTPGPSAGPIASPSLIDSEPGDPNRMASVNIIRADAFGGVRKSRKRKQLSSQMTSQIVENVIDSRFTQTSTSKDCRLSKGQSRLNAQIRFEAPYVPQMFQTREAMVACDRL